MFVCLFLTIWIWRVTSHTWSYEHIKSQSLLTCVTWLLHGWSSLLMCNMCGVRYSCATCVETSSWVEFVTHVQHVWSSLLMCNMCGDSTQEFVTHVQHVWSSWLMCNMCGDSRASTSRHRAFGHVWHNFYVCVWRDPSDPWMFIMCWVHV